MGVGSADGYDTAVRYLPDGQLDPSFASGGKLQFALSADDFDTTGTAVTLPDGDIVMTIGSTGLPLLAAVLPETPVPAPAPGQQPGQLVFATPTASVSAGNTAVFTVDRFGGSDGTVSVAYTTQDDTAVAGTDYTATSGTLTFAPGVTSQTLSIPTLVDPNASGDLSLDLVLQTPTGGATLGLTDIAALTITPAPPPPTPTTLAVTPVAGTYGTTATFAATLTASGAPLAGEPVTFTVTVGGHTTTLGTATTDASGVASLSSVSLTMASAGVYPGAVSASFGGDTTDAAATGSGDLTITSSLTTPTPTTLTVTPVVGTYGSTATFAATLTAAGAPLVGEPVAFTVTAGGHTTTLGTATTDARGVASLGGVSVGSVPAGTYPGAVSASFGGDASDAAGTGSGDLSIAQATPTLTWPMPADIAQGQALGAAQLDAKTSVSGTFAYSPPAGTVLPAGMGQTLTAVFTPADATDYKSVSVSTTLNVLPKSSTLTVTPVAGTYGATATFAATLTAAGAPLAGEPVTFTVTAGGRITTLGTATTDASGVASLSGVSLTIASAGVYAGGVSASFGGDSGIVGSGELSIAQATPTVTWSMPAGITQGQALGAAQLDAAASVPGTFAYSPPAGTVLPVGAGQTLTAVFTPADTTDYKSVSVSTTLNVLPEQNPTGSSNVTLMSIRGAKVRLGTGRKAKKATVVVLQFSGALNPSTAQNVADYSLLAGTIKKKVLGFNKSVPMASATYDPSAQTVTLLPQGKRKLPKYEQLTIRSGLLTDSLGRPIDGGHTVVVTVGKSGQVISQAATSAAPTPSATMVDALFAGEPGFSARDTVERLEARRSRGG